MQTLVDKTTNVSYLVFNDDRTMTISETGTVVNATSSDKYEDIGECILPTFTSSNTTKYTGVTEPADWIGIKYKFDGSSWTKNTDYKMVCHLCINNDKGIFEHDYDATTCSECGESL